MKNIKISLSILLFLGFTSCSEKNNIGFIENNKLYSEFDFTQELEGKLQLFSDSRTRELDSLKTMFELETKRFEKMEEIPSVDYSKYTDLRNTLVFKEKSYEEDLYSLKNEYQSSIWERLNEHIKDYAILNNYDFILGATGTGNLMFAKDSTNVTNKLITYSNLKFNGKK